MKYIRKAFRLLAATLHTLILAAITTVLLGGGIAFVALFGLFIDTDDCADFLKFQSSFIQVPDNSQKTTYFFQGQEVTRSAYYSLEEWQRLQHGSIKFACKGWYPTPLHRELGMGFRPNKTDLPKPTIP